MKIKLLAVLVPLAALLFGHVASAQTNSLIVDPSGNIGIGTDTPNNVIHSTRATGTNILHVEMTGNAATGSQAGFLFTNGGPGGVGQYFWDFRIGGAGNLIANFKSGPSEITYLTNGDLIILGSLTQGSSRYSKENLSVIDPMEVLAKVVHLPLMEWSYKSDPNVRHLGPMAEDFADMFAVGHTRQGINAIDADGVALAAIQGLHQIVQQKDERINALAQTSQQLRQEKDAQISDLTQRLEVLENALLNRQTN